jgi:hypothetical protein
VAKTPDMAALCAALHDLVSHAKRVEGRDGAQ